MTETVSPQSKHSQQRFHLRISAVKKKNKRKATEVDNYKLLRLSKKWKRIETELNEAFIIFSGEFA
jgi:CDP-diacylglycerol pyrophosphatase